jgi:ubiquinone/menaquinone biosynthesis C-methylase UbiE
MSAGRNSRGFYPLEKWSVTTLRRSLLQGVSGAVLEIGVGSGANLAIYSTNAQVTALDRNPDRLRKLAAKYPKSRHVLADAMFVPMPDNAFDYVIGTFVFCSIADPKVALMEVRRVLRPGGQLLLMEHVRGLRPVTRRLTDWLNPCWVRLTHECHLNRETAITVQSAGLQIRRTQSYLGGLVQRIEAVSPG